MRQIAKVRATMFRSMGPSADFCSSVVNLLEFWPGFGSKAHLFANLEKIKVEKSANHKS